MVYPGATPDFRILIREDGTQALQIRYVKSDIGYTSKWSDVPVVQETAAVSTATPA